MAQKMRAMVLREGKKELRLEEVDRPSPSKEELLIEVAACAICRTDLHIVDGELSSPKLPLIPGHQIVGRVVDRGETVESFAIGQRVGVPWLAQSCRHCHFCRNGEENLCDEALYTGYQKDGGFADYCVANEQFCFPLPDDYSDLEVAPLLCGGLIGYRSYRKTEAAKKIGFYGFGSSAHILIQLALFEGKEVYVFTREGDSAAAKLAKKLGAKWVGSSTEAPPEKLDAAILFAPVGALLPEALSHLRKGGRVVTAGIHMSDIPSFPYSLLWGERSICSVANLTRRDGEEFIALAPRIPISTEITCYPLEETMRALGDLRSGKITGSGVVVIGKS